MTTLISSILKLIALIFGEWLERKKRDRDYEMDRVEFEKITRVAIAKMRTQVAQDSQQASTMDDAMDDYIRKSEANNYSKEE